MKTIKYQGREVVLNGEQGRKYKTLSFRQNFIVGACIGLSLLVSGADIYYDLKSWSATGSIPLVLFGIYRDSSSKEHKAHFLKRVLTGEGNGG